MIKQFMTSDVLGPWNRVERRYAPEVLYYRGDLDLLRYRPRISLVGSRKVSPDGVARTVKLTKLLVREGAVIVSGLARGVDTTAHRTAIERGGRTIAVVGNGLDRIYPPENADLQELIARNHLLLSQFPTGAEPKSYHFPQRNRTMAILSDCTIIVEAQEKSGSLHQAWEALRLNRPLGILESSVNDAKLKWPKELIRYGAFVIRTGNLEDLLSELSWGKSEERSDAPF